MDRGLALHSKGQWFNGLKKLLIKTKVLGLIQKCHPVPLAGSHTHHQPDHIAMEKWLHIQQSVISWDGMVRPPWAGVQKGTFLLFKDIGTRKFTSEIS